MSKDIQIKAGKRQVSLSDESRNHITERYTNVTVKNLVLFTLLLLSRFQERQMSNINIALSKISTSNDRYMYIQVH